jgi:hypothetical protein
MIQGPIENVPGVFASDVLIYDLGWDVGIHALLFFSGTDFALADLAQGGGLDGSG